MVVVDTSIAFKWFDADEVGADRARDILRQHLSGRQRIWVPDLLGYELANAWSTKSRLTAKWVEENLKMLQKLKLHYLSLDFDLLENAAKLAKKYEVTVYDALYVVLAEEKRCKLVTADKRFAKKINSPDIELI